MCLCGMDVCFFVFFKQKTAYERRISDWSSDVCSSDLRNQLRIPRQLRETVEQCGFVGRLDMGFKRERAFRSERSHDHEQKAQEIPIVLPRPILPSEDMDHALHCRANSSFRFGHAKRSQPAA